MSSRSSTDSTQCADTNDIIEFPFRLQSDIPEFVVAGDMLVRRMNDETKTRLLRIKDAEYDENGRLSRCTCLSGSLIVDQPDVLNNLEFRASNYVLAVRSREQAADFNLALKLTGTSCSSLYLGYLPSGASYVINPPCYYGRSPLVITQIEVERLSRLIVLIEQGRNDKKLQTMSEIYLHALSRALREESRFIEIAVILEMLLLPSSSAELSYRFSLRLAKLMNKLFGESVTENFECARRVYSTRSNLVHRGIDRELSSVSSYAYRYAQLLLAAYFDNKAPFHESNLDALCLS